MDSIKITEIMGLNDHFSPDILSAHTLNWKKSGCIPVCKRINVLNRNYCFKIADKSRLGCLDEDLQFNLKLKMNNFYFMYTFI